MWNRPTNDINLKAIRMPNNAGKYGLAFFNDGLNVKIKEIKAATIPNLAINLMIKGVLVFWFVIFFIKF